MFFSVNDTANRIGMQGGPDILQIGTVLQAAGVNLDSVAETKNSYGLPVSKRYDGIVVLLFLEYSNLNDVSYNLKRIEYSYRAQIGSSCLHMISISEETNDSVS